ncbi:MAG TPA: hypothetical protein VJT73_13480 [Polyangiaceae bacterium]|nr:hypothetical protein [Polyangiaceae bacterium]
MGLAASSAAKRRVVYQRHRPERTALYEVVRDNLETLYGAIDDGALDVRLPKHAKKEPNWDARGDSWQLRDRIKFFM